MRWSCQESLFRFRSEKNKISPGDTIVVPLDADDVESRPLLAGIAIVYQLSLGAAASNRLTIISNNRSYMVANKRDKRTRVYLG